MSEWEYKVLIPEAPTEATKLESLLNDLGANGWEFVGPAETSWLGRKVHTTEWWVFKRQRGR